MFKNADIARVLQIFVNVEYPEDSRYQLIVILENSSSTEQYLLWLNDIFEQVNQFKIMRDSSTPYKFSFSNSLFRRTSNTLNC